MCSTSGPSVYGYAYDDAATWQKYAVEKAGPKVNKCSGGPSSMPIRYHLYLEHWVPRGSAGHATCFAKTIAVRSI